jgi:hypothetical protein
VKKAQKNTKLNKLSRQVHRRAKLTFVPHKANQFRPHLIRRYGLIVLLLLVIGLQAGYNFTTTGSVLGVETAISTGRLLTETNHEREMRGLPPLAADDQLNKAAFLKAKDMFTHQYWAHVAPNGTTPWQWLAKVNYNYASAGENLAKNFASSDATMAAWMASSEHKANILNADYREVGFAVADGMLDGEPTTIVVALYGQPARAVTAAAQTEAPASHDLGLATRAQIAWESLTPAAIAALIMVVVASVVALGAHFYRSKLPKKMQVSWYRHHGLLKVGGMLSLVMVMLFLYGGGQI